MLETIEKVESSLEGRSEKPESLEGPRKAVQGKWYKPNTGKAILAILTGIAFYAVSMYAIYLTLAYELYYLTPLAWFLGGTAVTSFFVLGHDCAHAAFLKSNRWNDFLGEIFFLFPFYPYYAWKYSHNAHHKFTNKLEVNAKDIYYDNAWIPLTITQYKLLKRFHPGKARMYRIGRYFPPLGSFMHNILTHFYPEKFNESQRAKVKFSYLYLGIGMILISSLIYFLTNSIWAIFHYYILPGLFFQFWMSLYTFQHHTSDEMEFYNPKEWNPYKGQILSTYNSLNPRFLSFLHLNIDVHTPHHLSTAIPCYHLRPAYEELKESIYKEDLKEGKLNLGYYLKQVRNCQLWDEKNKKYKKFSEV